MKRMIQGMLLSASALAFVAAPATVMPVFAQDTAASQCPVDVRDKVYNENFLKNYKAETRAQRKIAFDAATEYLQKYNAPNCTDNADVVKYLEGWLPKYKTWDEQMEAQEIATAINDDIKNNNAAGVFSNGKVLLAKNPDNLQVMLYMADQGFIQATKNVDTYNADTIATAKSAIEKINAGKAPEGNNWSPFKSKDDALAWLNYDIGYITNFRMKDKKSAAPYFYQATKYNSPDLSSAHVPYQSIGDWYLELLGKAVEEYNANKDKPTTEVSEEKKNELDGMWKAYADRAMEAYGRAYAKAKANPKTKPETTKAINDTLTQVYKLRKGADATGLDSYVAGLSSTPMTDPTSPVKPVVEERSTTTTAVSTVTAAETTADTPTKSVATNGAKTAANGAKTATATAKPAAAKKPVAKKGKNR